MRIGATWWIWVTSYNSILTLCVCFARVLKTGLSVQQLPRITAYSRCSTSGLNWIRQDSLLKTCGLMKCTLLRKRYQRPSSFQTLWWAIFFLTHSLSASVGEGDLLPIQVLGGGSLKLFCLPELINSLSLTLTMPLLSSIVIKRDLQLAIYEVSNGRLAIINRGGALTKTSLMPAQTHRFLWCY